MLLSSGLIAYFIVWMANQNRNIASSLKNSVDKNATGFGLLILSFLSVFREGIELVIFILTKIDEHLSNVAFGTALGIVLSIIVGYAIFKTSLKLNLKVIFKALGVILIFIGAELMGEGLVKFIPFGGELLEIIGAGLFIVVSLIYFLKDDINKYLKRE